MMFTRSLVVNFEFVFFYFKTCEAGNLNAALHVRPLAVEQDAAGVQHVKEGVRAMCSSDSNQKSCTKERLPSALMARDCACAADNSNTLSARPPQQHQ